MDRNISNWDEFLPFITHAYNTAPQKSTKLSPFYIVHGVEATTTFDTTFPPSPVTSTFSVMVYMEKLNERVEEARLLARDLVDRAKDDNKSEYDKKRTGTRWAVNDLGLVHFPFRKVGQSDKLQKCFFGPYEIVEQKGPETFQVVAKSGAAVPGPQRRELLVHSARLKPFFDNRDIGESEEEEPPTEIVDDRLPITTPGPTDSLEEQHSERPPPAPGESDTEQPSNETRRRQRRRVIIYLLL